MKDKDDFSIKVGGEAGQGINTIGSILSRSFADHGLRLFAHQDYYSRVRGGHNFYQVRVAPEPVYSYSNETDILVALDQASLDLHTGELNKNGVIVYDQNEIEPQSSNEQYFALPMAELGEKHGGKKVMGNTVAAGAVWHIMGGTPDILENTLRKLFREKGNEIAESNIKAARAGASYAAENFSGRCDCSLEKPDNKVQMVLTGNESLALGALAGGCRFISSYPMTPVSEAIQYIARQAKRLPLAFEQAEDEISAITMSIGAAYAGIRSMVATSGSGFSLMVEGLSLAGMTETPIVILLGQRPGPATGMATRTEQGELLFALHAGNGEFPRAILAPHTVEDAFWAAVHAFNLSEKYQIPVFILSDQHLADSYLTVEPYDLSIVNNERGNILSSEKLNEMPEYKRYQVNESGISPRAFPGQSKHCVISTGNEHAESGYSTEDPAIRRQMAEKRIRKFRSLAKDIMPPVQYGPDNPETLLLTWGSSYGACHEAVELANQHGEKMAVACLKQLWPFPKEKLLELINRANRLVTVEMNATGQLGRLLRVETGMQPDHAVLKYDGRPMNASYVLEQLEKGGTFPWQ